MDVEQDWSLIRQTWKRAQKSQRHQMVVSCDQSGQPHLTPIGSLCLHPSEPRGLYLDILNTTLRHHLDHDPQLSLIAIDTSLMTWVKGLVRGRFQGPVGIRLKGSAQSRRPGTPEELSLLKKRFALFRHTRGYQLLWQNASYVRELSFHHASPVPVGKLTSNQMNRK